MQATAKQVTQQTTECDDKKLPTIAQIRAAIPAHCFQRNLTRSLGFVARDTAMALTVLALGCLLSTVSTALPTAVSFVLWSAYAFLQGTVLTGLWVLAHECGHGAFCDSALINDVVGFVLHTLLFVPYFSWQYSHARHHARTNHLLEGESHTPATQKGFMATYKKVFDLLGEDAFAVFQMVAHLVFGWPLYLLLNATGGRRTFDGVRANDKSVGVMDHFRPWSRLFPANWRVRVALSTVGLFVWAGVLFALGSTYGHGLVAKLFVGPYMVVNAWLVLYTWLQHTEHHVPHFGEDQWTWIKGAALGTVDRPYGVFDWFHHHIGSTHVAHHLFSAMPHYNAVEATEHVKRVLGDKYNYCPDALPVALWRISKTCHFVPGLEGEQTYTWLGADNKLTTKSKGA